MTNDECGELINKIGELGIMHADSVKGVVDSAHNEMTVRGYRPKKGSWPNVEYTLSGMLIELIMSSSNFDTDLYDVLTDAGLSLESSLAASLL